MNNLVIKNIHKASNALQHLKYLAYPLDLQGCPKGIICGLNVKLPLKYQKTIRLLFSSKIN